MNLGNYIVDRSTPDENGPNRLRPRRQNALRRNWGTPIVPRNTPSPPNTPPPQSSYQKPAVAPTTPSDARTPYFNAYAPWYMNALAVRKPPEPQPVTNDPGTIWEILMQKVGYNPQQNRNPWTGQVAGGNGGIGRWAQNSSSY